MGKTTLLGFDEKVPGVIMDLDTSYIELQFEPTDSVKNETYGDVQDIDNFIHRSRRISVVGQAGSGKTTLLANLAVRAATNDLTLTSPNGDTLIPLFVRLRDYSKANLPTGKKLFALISPHLPAQLADSWVANLLRENRALFLIDGIDELPDKQITQFDEWLDSLVSISPRSVYVVTSRPLTTRPRFGHRSKFLQIVVKPFGLSQIEAYLEAWHSYIATILTSDVEKDRLQKMYRQLSRMFEKNI